MTKHPVFGLQNEQNKNRMFRHLLRRDFKLKRKIR